MNGSYQPVDLLVFVSQSSQAGRDSFPVDIQGRSTYTFPQTKRVLISFDISAGTVRILGHCLPTSKYFLPIPSI
jgi:hypothetical protein